MLQIYKPCTDFQGSEQLTCHYKEDATYVLAVDFVR